MAMVLTVKFTRADYEALPEGYPVELIDGQLVKDPSPTYGHQWIVGRLHIEFYRIVGPSRVVVSPIDVFVDDHNVLQPDILVLDEPLSPKVAHVGIPALVVEVLSKSTAHRDRVVKRDIYLRAGVREVWILDPEAETIEVYTSRGVRSFALDDPVSSGVLPAFDLALGDLLRE
jgi:Uma2 family endonuclease